jgi:tetratricopeptide (TPR) repeat protein
MAREGRGADDDLVLAVLIELGTSAKLAGFRPRTVQVRDSRLGASLERALEGAGVRVEVVRDLPALEAFLAAMAHGVGGEPVPGALTAPGVTPERLRAFADAAKAFYEAAPWRHLGDGDLVRVEAPKAGKGLSLFGVMGSAGREFGLSFFLSADQYEAVLAGASPEEVFQRGGAWSVNFDPPWHTPFSDLDAWQKHDLPLAAERAYPSAYLLGPATDPRRPDAGLLAYFEGLLRAMALTTEAEMDSGRWSHEVTTAEGVVRYTLALPDLVDPRPKRSPSLGRGSRRAMERLSAEIARMFRDAEYENLDDANAALDQRLTNVSLDELPSTAETPLERAQDLMYEAFEARGRRQLQLIRRALEISPDCADAYVLLAERSSSVPEQRDFYERGVAAGERAIGRERLDDPDTSFWGDVATRPYMRARFGLADRLEVLGETDAAADHLRALLRLNPADNQGVRYRLLVMLVVAGRNEEAEVLLKEHDEESALWLYTGVLLALRRQDRQAARKRLRAALKANRHVPRYLTGQRALPDEMPDYYTPGADDEAAMCTAELDEAWERTPGAVAWLRLETRKRK